MLKYEGKTFPCATSLTMELIGGKWKCVILVHLIDGKKRYHEFLKFAPDITERTLSRQLHQLEEDGLISKTVYNTKPPLRVEYELTEFGQSLVPILKLIAHWGYDLASDKGEIIGTIPELE